MGLGMQNDSENWALTFRCVVLLDIQFDVDLHEVCVSQNYML